MIEKLTQLYEELVNAPGKFPEGAPRILFAGRALAIGDYTVPRVLKESGGVIVAEMLDEGVRVIEKDVELEGDLMHNFAKNRYLDKTPIDLFQPSWQIRYEKMKQLISDYKVDGVIWYRPWQASGLLCPYDNRRRRHCSVLRVPSHQRDRRETVS